MSYIRSYINLWPFTTNYYLFLNYIFTNPIWVLYLNYFNINQIAMKNFPKTYLNLLPVSNLG